MKDDDTNDLGPSVEEYVRGLLNGGIFDPPSAFLEPFAAMHGWEAMGVTGSWGQSHHLVGVVDGVGRVSSPIKKFDPSKREITTRSGRVYRLHDEKPTISQMRDREYVRSAWLTRNGLAADAFTDVTQVYLDQLK